VRVLSGRTDFTLDSLIATAYDPYLIAFDKLLPPLFAAFDALPAGDPQRAALAGPLHALRGWNRRTTLKSVPTSVAVIWAQELVRALSGVARARDVPLIDHVVAASTGAQKLAALQAAITRLTRDFGKWQTPWGEINRFQRLSGAIDAGFDDTKPSLPVAFTSADWGSLAAFSVTGPPQHTKKIYGNRGNSFVAVVEFGPQLRAKSILAGGESGDPASPHFADQAERYTKAKFKNVLFYRRDVEKNAERMYHPGG
jgi:acyl-homoserine-lactone acylase